MLNELEKEVKEALRMEAIVPHDHVNKMKCRKYSLFAKANGAQFGDFNIKWKDPNFSYMYALKDLEKGAVILSIPTEML